MKPYLVPVDANTILGVNTTTHVSLPDDPQSHTTHLRCYYFLLNCKTIVFLILQPNKNFMFIDYCSVFWNNFCETAIQVFLVADSQLSFYGNGRLIDLTFMRAKNSWSAKCYIFSRRKLGGQIRRLCLTYLNIDYRKFLTIKISFSF